MPPFNGRQIQQQLRPFLVFIQLQIIMYFHFLRQAQQPPPAPPAPIQRPRRRHNMWVRPWLLQREERGAYHNIMADLYATDIPGFTNYMRMTPEFFEMMKTRLELKDYFNNEGAVAWQDAEYKSCCSKQSFSGLTNSPFQDYQIFQKQLISYACYRRTNPMPNITCTGRQTDKPHAKHNFFR